MSCRLLSNVDHKMTREVEDADVLSSKTKKRRKSVTLI